MGPPHTYRDASVEVTNKGGLAVCACLLRGLPLGALSLALTTQLPSAHRVLARSSLQGRAERRRVCEDNGSDIYCVAKCVREWVRLPTARCFSCSMAAREISSAGCCSKISFTASWFKEPEELTERGLRAFLKRSDASASNRRRSASEVGGVWPSIQQTSE